MYNSSFLPTARPIDLPFQVNSYLRLPFVLLLCAKLTRANFKLQQNVNLLLQQNLVSYSLTSVNESYEITTQISSYKQIK